MIKIHNIILENSLTFLKVGITVPRVLFCVANNRITNVTSPNINDNGTLQIVTIKQWHWRDIFATIVILLETAQVYNGQDQPEP